MARILCIGLNPALDTTIDLDALVVGEVNRSQNSQTHPAGKALNVASLLSALGHQVVMTGFLGQDNAQEFLTVFDTLTIENQCILVQGSTRQNIKIAERDGRMTDINGAGFLVDDHAKTVLFEKVATLASQTDFVVVTGSLPMGFGTDDFAKLLMLIKQSTTKLIVDTSGQALKVACDYQPFLIKPNRSEVTGAFGVPSDSIDEQADFVRSLAGIDHVVISMGEDGVNWWQNDGNHATSLHATTPKVTIKSTVGAGDTLLSGMIHGLATCDDPKAILTQAVAMAAHTVSVVGVAVARLDRLDELTTQIDISPLTIQA